MGVARKAKHVAQLLGGFLFFSSLPTRDQHVLSWVDPHACPDVYTCLQPC